MNLRKNSTFTTFVPFPFIQLGKETLRQVFIVLIVLCKATGKGKVVC